MVSSKPILVSTFIAWSAFSGPAAVAQTDGAEPTDCASDLGTCTVRTAANEKWDYDCTCNATGSHWIGLGLLNSSDATYRSLCESQLNDICAELDPEHVSLPNGERELHYSNITGNPCPNREPDCDTATGERHLVVLKIRKDDHGATQRGELSMLCPVDETYVNAEYPPVEGNAHKKERRAIWGNTWNVENPRVLRLAILDLERTDFLEQEIGEDKLAAVAEDLIDASCKTITAGLTETGGKADDAAIEEDAIGCALAPAGRPTLLLLALGLLALARRRRASGPR